jgi:hypothetical protein
VLGIRKSGCNMIGTEAVTTSTERRPGIVARVLRVSVRLAPSFYAKRRPSRKRLVLELLGMEAQCMASRLCILSQLKDRQLQVDLNCNLFLVEWMIGTS